MKSVLERKIFDEEQQVTLFYLRGLLQITQKELAALAHTDITTIKRAESPNNVIRNPTAVQLVTVLNNELHKQGHLSEGKILLIQHIAMHVS